MNKKEIIEQLKICQEELAKVAELMKDHFYDKSLEATGASSIIDSWIVGVQNETMKDLNMF